MGEVQAKVYGQPIQTKVLAYGGEHATMVAISAKQWRNNDGPAHTLS